MSVEMKRAAYADGKLLTYVPAEVRPMAPRYFLF